MVISCRWRAWRSLLQSIAILSGNSAMFGRLEAELLEEDRLQRHREHAAQVQVARILQQCFHDAAADALAVRSAHRRRAQRSPPAPACTDAVRRSRRRIVLIDRNHELANVAIHILDRARQQQPLACVAIAAWRTSCRRRSQPCTTDASPARRCRRARRSVHELQAGRGASAHRAVVRLS